MAKEFAGNAVATAVTCGVDSMFTIMKYTSDDWNSLKLNQLVITNSSVDLWNTVDKDLYKLIDEHKSFFKRYESIAKETGLPLMKIYSNYVHHVCKKSKYKIAHLYVHNYITMACILAVKKLLRIYYFSSTMPYTIFTLENSSTQDTDRHELLSNHILASPDFLCYSSGISRSRIDKTRLLADWPLAHKYLHPCFINTDKNCCHPKCMKCLRALLTLDYYGKLDNFTDVFDISRYRSNKNEYLSALVEYRNNEYFIELYEMYLKKYPLDMKNVMDQYIMDSFISKDEYNVMIDALRLANKFLNFPDFEARLAKLFDKHNIKTLCIIGNGNLGNQITEIIRRHINTANWKDENAKDCDASLILCIQQKYIADAQNKIAKFKFPLNYTLFSLHDELAKI